MIAVESPIREFYDFYEIQPISAGWGVCQILIAYSPNLAAAVAAMLLSGVIWGPYLALEATLAQRLVPPEQHGQIFGMRTCLLIPTAPLGTAVGGGLLSLLQPPTVIVRGGFLCLAVGLAALTYHLSQRIRYDDKIFMAFC